MKFTLIIASAALLTLGSCAKNYSCECTSETIVPEYIDNGIVLQNDTTFANLPTTKYVNGKKKDAESRCKDFGPEGSYNVAPGVMGADSTQYVMTCTLGAKI